MGGVTYYCGECVVNWWPYQAVEGCCPMCGGGTQRRLHEAVSPEADGLMRKRAAREKSEFTHRQFEDFYAAREARLNGLHELPVVNEGEAA